MFSCLHILFHTVLVTGLLFLLLLSKSQLITSDDLMGVYNNFWKSYTNPYLNLKSETHL